MIMINNDSNDNNDDDQESQDHFQMPDQESLNPWTFVDGGWLAARLILNLTSSCLLYIFCPYFILSWLIDFDFKKFYW